MTLPRQDKYRLRDFDIDPAKHTIAGPSGTKRVRASSMEVLCLLAEHYGSYIRGDKLLHTVFPASGDSHGLLTACVDELRNCFGDTGPAFSFIEYDDDHGYRLLAKPESLQDHRRDDDGDGWFDELKRRRVFRVVAAYAVAAWLFLQIVDVLSGALPVPDWTLTATTIALAAGFPVSALLAWIFQITPQGIERENELTGGTVAIDRTRLVHYIDLVIIGALLIVVVFLSYGRIFPMLQDDDEVRVAVLPFENLGGNPDDAYLGEGIADDIRARLYDIPQFLIAARTSSRSLVGKGFDIRSIGNRLGVQHVLEGTVRRAGDQLRLDVQLVDVESGFSRWDKSYDTRVDEVLQLQNQISLIVASELHVALTKTTRESLARNATDDPVAFDLYLRAKNYLDRPASEENLDRARTLFSEAIEHDENFALGYAGLCQSYISRFRSTGDTSFIVPAEENCNKALVIDASLAEVHTSLGHLYVQGGKLDEAQAAFDDAIELDPRAVDARVGLGDVFSRQNKLEDAEAQYMLAIELLPANWNGYNHYARFLVAQARFDEAISNYERSIELAPDFVAGYSNIGVVYYLKGEFDNAAEYYRQSLELAPGRAAYSNTGTMYYYAGEYELAADMFSRAIEEAENDYRLWGNLADAQRFDKVTPDRGRASYEKATELVVLQLQLDPDDRDALTNQAWYAANLGDIESASTMLATALGLQISDPSQLYTVALVQILLGNTAAARQTLIKAESSGYPRAIIEATPEFQDIDLDQDQTGA